MAKYNLVKKNGEIIEGITIDETAKEDIKELMNWSEHDWGRRTTKS